LTWALHLLSGGTAPERLPVTSVAGAKRAVRYREVLSRLVLTGSIEVCGTKQVQELK
jgi:hypothetical protein